MAACGHDCTLVVDVHGVVYVMGRNHGGQLGWPHSEAQLHQDRYWEDLETQRILSIGVPVVMQEISTFADAPPLRAVFVDACSDSSCVLMSDGSIATSEIGWPRSRLTRRVFASQVVSVACGTAHMLVATQQGHVLSRGMRAEGQCGRGPMHASTPVVNTTDATFTEFVRVECDDEFDNTTFVFVAAGQSNSSCVGSNGSVFTFGNGITGMNGHGSTVRCYRPTKISAHHFDNRHVAMTSLGRGHAAAVTTDGFLYTWGMNVSGQLGLDHFRDQTSPQLVEALQAHTVRTVACGFTHCVAATEIGDCWQWGAMTDGRRGLPAPAPRSSTPQLLRPMADGSGVRIVAVAAGNVHNAATTEDGRLFTWGSANGLGKDGDHRLSVTVCPHHVQISSPLGRWHDLSPICAMAFVMGSHTRLGRAGHFADLHDDLLWRIIRACVWRPEGPGARLDGMMRVMGADKRV